MAAISDFFFGTMTIQRTRRTLLTYFWDHWHFYSDQCYKNALITIKMPLAVKGLTLGGGEGVKYVPWVCSNCRGVASLGGMTDRCSYVV